MPINREKLEDLDGKDLRLLVELEDTGSISKAAERCGIGQPAASKRLQRMSNALEIDLVEREASGSRSLTAAGQMIAAHGRRTLTDLDKLKQNLAEL